MSEDLRSCPFCGTTALRVINVYDPDPKAGPKRVSHDNKIAGFGCFVAGPIRPTEAEAIDAWNTRSLKDQVASPSDGAVLRMLPPVASPPFVIEDDADPAAGVTADKRTPYIQGHDGKFYWREDAALRPPDLRALLEKCQDRFRESVKLHGTPTLWQYKPELADEYSALADEIDRALGDGAGR